MAKLYDMLPADAGNTSQGRTAADNQAVRSVFLVGPVHRTTTTRRAQCKEPQTREDWWRFEHLEGICGNELTIVAFPDSIGLVSMSP